MDGKRNIVYFKSYFKEFYEAQKRGVREKIDYVLFLVATVERIPKKFFSDIEGEVGLYEIRIEYESNIYRIFCFFDEGKLVILMNGFRKKTQKTPKQEIEKARRIKEEYFYLKGDKRDELKK